MNRSSVPLWIMLALLVLPVSLVPAQSPAQAAERTLRLGVLGFGTVAWELETIRSHGLAEAEGLDLQVRDHAVSHMWLIVRFGTIG